MLISIHDLINRHQLKITGILHAGAHHCEEIDDYETYIPRKNILWIEAIPENVQYCKNKYPDICIENAVVSDTYEYIDFHVSNNGQSSSFLEFDKHKHYYPSIEYTRSFQAMTSKIDDILLKHTDVIYNFINLDIQGTELRALKGMENYLKHVDYIYTEINKAPLYKDCALIEDVDTFLNQKGFMRVETEWTHAEWGDAFYIKNICPLNH